MKSGHVTALAGIAALLIACGGSRTLSPGFNLKAVWGTTLGDVWIVGASGLLHSIETSLIPIATPGVKALAGVWVGGPNEVWAVGPAAIVHWDGRDMTVFSHVPVPGFAAVWGIAGAGVWAVGSRIVSRLAP
jgi:hypothetical protein